MCACPACGMLINKEARGGRPGRHAGMPYHYGGSMHAKSCNNNNNKHTTNKTKQKVATLNLKKIEIKIEIAL